MAGVIDEEDMLKYSNWLLEVLVFNVYELI